VVIVGRRQDALEQTAKLSARIRVSVGDVTQLDAVEHIVNDAVAHFDRLDALVNNAGMLRKTPLRDAALVLLGPNASWITGQVIGLDGGYGLV